MQELLGEAFRHVGERSPATVSPPNHSHHQCWLSLVLLTPQPLLDLKKLAKNMRDNITPSDLNLSNKVLIVIVNRVQHEGLC